MRRSLALALLVLFAMFTWARADRPLKSRDLRVVVRPVALARHADPDFHLGAFRLEGAWQLASRWSNFGSYSALLAMPDGTFLAFSDSGTYLRFSPPDTRRKILMGGDLLSGYPMAKTGRDVESATRDPKSGRIWLGVEWSNSVVRLARDLRPAGKERPSSIRRWGENSGPEAMVRLSDGRFVLLREAFAGWFESRRHDAVVFEGDPVAKARSWHFVFEGPEGFCPTDMTELPDGRVLILMRKLVWPAPQRFAGRLAIADPRDIRPGKPWTARTVARIASSLPVDNFEGIAVLPAPAGRLAVWIISDDNVSSFQRTILWKLSVDPGALP